MKRIIVSCLLLGLIMLMDAGRVYQRMNVVPCPGPIGKIVFSAVVRKVGVRVWLVTFVP